MSSARQKIYHPDDVQWASLEIRRFADQHGASQNQAWELATAVSELVSNVLKYAGEGDLSFSLEAKPRRAVRVEVRDRGPGIADIEFAFQDGVSQGQRMLLPGVETLRDGHRSLGHGLGAVQRLVDDLEIKNREKGGLKVVCIKYLST